MGRPRRSSSGGSHRELLLAGSAPVAAASAGSARKKASGRSEHGATTTADGAAWLLTEILLHWRDDRGRGLLHGAPESRQGLAAAAAGLARLRHFEQGEVKEDHPHHRRPDRLQTPLRLRERCLTLRDGESGYTPLHATVLKGDLAATLLLLRHAAAAIEDDLATPTVASELLPLPPRLPARPMDLLSGGASRVGSTGALRPCLAAAVSAKDSEGWTPAQLLASRQRTELEACRNAVLRNNRRHRPDPFSWATYQTRQRLRRSSFDIEEPGDDGEDNVAPNDFVVGVVDGASFISSSSSAPRYGCEVFTFGRAHHGALGNGPDTAAPASSSSSSSPALLRPQRVPVGSPTNPAEGGAVAVAAAAHHTLVATASGRLYAFGLGKGGRLGTGDEGPRPLPVRIKGPLHRRRVTAVAAAEHHSLCVTDEGQVFAWGSNGFGQLGGRSPPGPEARCLPRRVDDLSSVPCSAVAAGARHSVALSRNGEVYVWGDNGSGQLATSRRTGPHRVRRVETLWGHDPPRVTIAVAASDHATLALTLPSDPGKPSNALYAWGHGNHVPSRVHLTAGSETRAGGERGPSFANNPVAIACARHHHVAVTSEGRVYTWGLHAETLGTGKPDKRAGTGNPSAAPQLVTGMLPEHGGGLVVGVSASENHTAVVTDTGALYTWGATHGKNVLGHEGVRWQPDPKRVPGVFRAVGVAAAKEHTVLLVGTTFPPLPVVPSEPSLTHLASRAVAEHVDLFTAIPSLITAERCHCAELVAYCEEFVRRNFDAVLQLGQKSVMDCYLDEQLAAGLWVDDGGDCDEYSLRDGSLHPLLLEILVAAGPDRPGIRRRALSGFEPWLRGCQVLVERPDVKRFVARLRASAAPSSSSSSPSTGGRPRSQSCGSKGGGAVASLPATQECDRCSERCLQLTENMDLSSKELVEGKLALLTKEMRWVRKRLGQISKLEDSVKGRQSESVSAEECAKIARRPQLEADLLAFEPAFELVENRLKELSVIEATPASKEVYVAVDNVVPAVDKADSTVQVEPLDVSVALRCRVCQISCPDEISYALHLSGRKHRNRLAQAEKEEKASVAAAIVEQKNKDQVLDRIPSVPRCLNKNPSPSAWRNDKGSPQPLYTLPNPPIPVPDSMVRPGPTRVSLQDIISEESVSRSRETNAFSPKPLSLPKGSAPPLRHPPWAQSKSFAQAAPPTAKPSIPTGAALALGDFLTAPKPAPPVRATAQVSTQLAWGARRVNADAPSTSLQAIQEQERDFKLRQDKACGLGDSGNRKWFVEQRERAGSMQDIQQQDEKDREMRLLVEEQFQIEKQIQDEINAKRSAEKKTKKKPPRSTSKKSAQTKRRGTP